MKIILTFTSIILFVFASFSQTSSIIGSPTANEYAIGVCADNFGNVYLGATNNDEAWIFKRDVNNNVVWSKKLNTLATGYSSDVSYVDVIGDTVFGCGWFKSGSTILGGLLFKLNATTGNPYWVKSEAFSNTYFSSVKYANGKYFASGSQVNNTLGYNGKVIAVSSTSGAIIWQTPALGLTFPGYGIDYIDDFQASTEMVNGKMFITGRSYVNATPTNMRTFLVGIDDLGNVFLTKYLLFNTATSGDNRFYGINIDYDGQDSLVILQHGDDNCSSCTDFKVGLVKTDLNGNVSWSKQYDFAGAGEIGRGIDVTPNGYVFYGYANWNQPNSKTFVVKTDKNGTLQLAKYVSLGTGNLGHSFGPIVCGGSSSYINGKHYIPGSYFTTNANSRDIAQIVLDQNLQDPLGCLNIAPATATVTSFTPFSSILDLNAPADNVNFSITPNLTTFTYVSPCNGSVTFNQNPSCNSTIITASISSVNNPNFNWSNGQIGNSITVYNNDTLIVSISDPVNCCLIVDTIIPQISVASMPEAIFSATPTNGEIPLLVNLTNSSLNASSFIWDFGNGQVFNVQDLSNQEMVYYSEGEYTIWLIANGECGSDSISTVINVNGSDNNPWISIPNVFTPNKDGVNENWMVQSNHLESLDLLILNRWGNVISRIEKTTDVWNGKTEKGDDVTAGVYFYTYNAKGINGKVFSGHGFITLIR